jgi:hypothetical protein
LPFFKGNPGTQDEADLVFPGTGSPEQGRQSALVSGEVGENHLELAKNLTF